MNDWKYYTPKFECDELNYDFISPYPMRLSSINYPLYVLKTEYKEDF